MRLVASIDGTQRMMGVVIEEVAAPHGSLADLCADVASGLERRHG